MKVWIRETKMEDKQTIRQTDINNVCLTEQSLLSQRRRATFSLKFFFFFLDNECLGVHSSVSSWSLECGYLTF